MKFEPSNKKDTRKVTRAGSQPQGQSQQALTRGSTVREESDGENYVVHTKCQRRTRWDGPGNTKGPSARPGEQNWDSQAQP